ncbi:hypothetical protein [Brooklawnia cerclae]|uniref:Uncharacterized protein n=1 Tax=Brooklawnia cerclae TaxID=349934 RepID=A0ABX0SLU4_9ACTN|nr:hypothetical protein [Brooklawnia cerclae]NIH57716.1 hypothetical protein [Brooklawnia cerclae]
MSISDSVPADTGNSSPSTDQPDAAGKFSINEDWLAVIVGLVLLALALTGVIPEGLVP